MKQASGTSVVTIKSLVFINFSIELVELLSGEYSVHYTTGEKPHSTGRMSDLNTAMYVFDDLVLSLGGH